MPDAIIIGAGPAGLAAAIALQRIRKTVVVLERGRDVADGPGETFHPGIEPIFEQLGVAKNIVETAHSRHGGIHVEYPTHNRHVPYGPGWRGFQVRRKVLSGALSAKYSAQGGHIEFSSLAYAYERHRENHVVHTKQATWQSKLLIDASGKASWLDRQLGTAMETRSPRIWLHYGYTKTASRVTTDPVLTLQPERWRWQAPLGDGETAWVEGTGKRYKTKPTGARILDGTWKKSALPAGPGFFRVGDSACRLDPRNGHGVLRAMMSSIMCVHLYNAVANKNVTPTLAANLYQKWLNHWFEYDATQLRSFDNVENNLMI